MKNLFEIYKNCSLCPRNCRIDRTIQKGYCGESDEVRIDSALIHFGEEPPISHKKGSGTIFFNGCSLRCVYCQNMQISQNSVNNNKYTLEQFVKLIEDLILKGAENINFVTPDHFLPHIIEGIKIIKEKGYNVPFVYNCSGYETIEHLRLINDLIDIYLFDYKYSEKELAKLYSLAPDYHEKSLEALKFIFENKGNFFLDKNGKALKGILIRHLILPGYAANSMNILDNLFFNFGNKIFLSLMSQYTPVYLKPGFPEIARRINYNEYQIVIDHAMNLGFTNCYIQEFINSSDKYIPDFKEKKIFDSW